MPTKNKPYAFTCALSPNLKLAKFLDAEINDANKNMQDAAARYASNQEIYEKGRHRALTEMRRLLHTLGLLEDTDDKT